MGRTDVGPTSRGAATHRPYARMDQNGPFGTSEPDQSSGTLGPMEANAGGFALVDIEKLQLRVDRARRRVDDATIGSPDWDAAMAELEEVEEIEARLARRAPASAPVELVG
jgi:hypothetical protein